MEKQKRWQFYLIVGVLLATLYSVLPTVFYYSKPLYQPIGAERAKDIALESIARVNELEEESLSWLKSFTHLIGANPKSIEVDQDNPALIHVAFKTSREANVFKRFLPTAGATIPFVPAQLKLGSDTNPSDPNTVTVERNIGVRIDPENVDGMFTFSKKFDDQGNITPFYRDLTYNRITEVAESIAGPSTQALQVSAIVDHPTDKRFDQLAINVAKDIVSIDKTFGASSPIVKRYYKSFSQIDRQDRSMLLEQFQVRLSSIARNLEEEIKSASNDAEKLYLLESNLNAVKSAGSIVKKREDQFKQGSKPIDSRTVAKRLEESAAKIDRNDYIQVLDLAGYNPFIKGLKIDWTDGYVELNLYDDVQDIRTKEWSTELDILTKEKLNQYVFNEIARTSQQSDESITPSQDSFKIQLETLTNSKSFLAWDLGALATTYAKQIESALASNWKPVHGDLQKKVYPVRSFEKATSESTEDQKLGLVIYVPSSSEKAPPKGFREGSIYVIARGLESIVAKYDNVADSEEGQQLVEDFKNLQATLQSMGFVTYPGSSYGIDPEYKKDYIFEFNNYYGDLVKATREDYYVKGSKKYAVLDFTDVEQRILATNRIEDKIQEDLVKWKEEYQTAQVAFDPMTKYTVPEPTKSVYVENLKLTASKYFRGDDRKILKWGLDLSGGKTVRIGLRDQNNRPVTDPESLNQAVNELYTRINKMGVAERTIRVENDSIILDFPGSQAFSAAELVKASAMYFHIANEKFSPYNNEISETVSRFLQEVWNEAVVTNRKDIDSINEIAWKHMGGEIGTEEISHPRSEHAKTLYENGLRLANPRMAPINSSFNDTVSMVAQFRGDDPSDWYGQTHPLLFVFRNYALEGSSLDNVQVGYDQSEGNVLHFSVKSSYTGPKESSKGNPRDDFYTWTSAFAQEKIAGTAKEKYSHGRGWRMAVILNGQVVSAPTLRGALRDGGQITGRFTQREITQLAADLKAGSLSFTPKILSEQNVSPDLGKGERTKGIRASLIAIALVAITMIGYYRFAGLIAFCAVLFNLVVMWGVLQSIGAALTLPGIAGIVLTIGMAVDANVLVFERIREEFQISGRLASAVQAGYRKAFSAIIDSNITTIMAALILIQFDSGPIKGFAVVIIIGIATSMFTSLFMTRYFFAGWVQNPKHKELKMSHWIGNTNFDFLKWAPKVISVSLVILVAGSYMLFSQKNTILGMDFTGGYSLTLNLEEKGEQNYRAEAASALLAAGASQGDIEVRELSRPNQLRLQLGMSMEESGHPFYKMPEETDSTKTTYAFESNPRINWIVKALEEKGLTLQQSSLDNLDKDWSAMSGQLSDRMRNNALMALSLALLGILLYITFRFEFKYAIGAVIALGHDVIITLGIAAFFHKLGFPVQIDLQIIGAIMTIIGYSLNDTIIVFDRIREEVHILRKLSFREIINHSLNITLSRTLMTSGTTLLVLLALVFFGGPAIFGFSLVMTIGVLVGTISSLFVAAPAMLFFHQKEHANGTGRVKAKG